MMRRARSEALTRAPHIDTLLTVVVPSILYFLMIASKKHQNHNEQHDTRDPHGGDEIALPLCFQRIDCLHHRRLHPPEEGVHRLPR